MSTDSEKITVYTANDKHGNVFRTATRSFREIWRYRQLVWTLFSRDFRAQFKQSIFGYFWTVLGPLLGVFSFVFMNFMGILNPGKTSVPYPLYAFIGTSLWGFLMSSIGYMGGGLSTHSELIMRTNIPKIALAASAVANIVYTILVSLVLIVLFTILSRVPLGWSALAFPLLILPLVVLGSGIGLAVSVVGIIAKDIGKLVNQFFSLLMFLTPVFFVADNVKIPFLHRLIVLNPLTYLVEVPRSVLLGQAVPYWQQYGAAAFGSAVIFLLGVKIFDVVQDLVAERL